MATSALFGRIPGRPLQSRLVLVGHAGGLLSVSFGSCEEGPLKAGIYGPGHWEYLPTSLRAGRKHRHLSEDFGPWDG